MIKNQLVFALLFFASLNVFPQNYDETKKNIINSIENHEEEIIKIIVFFKQKTAYDIQERCH